MLQGVPKLEYARRLFVEDEKTKLQPKYNQTWKKQQPWGLWQFFLTPDNATDPLNNLVPSPAPTAQPDTPSTSASMSGGEGSSYLPTPPLCRATSSPPLTSSRLSSALDRSPLPMPECAQFRPRPARTSKRVSSLFLGQTMSCGSGLY